MTPDTYGSHCPAPSATLLTRTISNDAHLPHCHILVDQYQDRSDIARHETVPSTVFIGIDDRQVPNFTSYALATALPDSQVVTVEATWDYDPHMVLHREVEGHDALSTWLSE